MSGRFDVANFYGGDLQGVLDKMDYLEELGVEVSTSIRCLYPLPATNTIHRIMTISIRILV